MMDILEEIIFSDKSGNSLTQYALPGGTKFSYSVYDANDNLLGSWLGDEDLGILSLRDFRNSIHFDRFIDLISGDFVDVKPTTKKSYLPASNTTSSYKPETNLFNFRDHKPQVNHLNIEDYTKSDTLVFHLADPSTVMLKQIYKGKGFDVVTQGFVAKEDVHKLMEAHDRIICLGHGTSYGLIGGNIGPEEGPYFKDKNLFIIWCNADSYFKKNCPEARGKFITGNMPSESWECKSAGCGNISKELMLENITYWSKLCAEASEQALSGDVEGAVDYIRKNYLEQYGNHPVTIYNAERTSGLGVNRPLPGYVFKGKPLTRKDFPYPGFNEEEFLKNPVPYAKGDETNFYEDLKYWLETL